MTSGIQYVLCLNSGSSSLKYALYRMAQEDETLMAQGSVERIGLDGGRLWIRTGRRASTFESSRDFPNHGAAVEAAFGQIEGLRLARPTAVGHRIVHGGLTHLEPVKVDQGLVAELRKISSFAPLHLPSRYGTRPYRSARRKHTAFRSSCDISNSRAAGLQSQYEIRSRV